MCDILLVEDNEPFRRMLQESLSERFPDAEIEAVDTGEAAVERHERLLPRILLLDIGLPGMNGLNVIKIIRSRDADVAIVVVTGNDLPEYREAAYRFGANYFVSKNSVRLGEIISLAGVLIGEDEPADDVPKKFRISRRTGSSRRRRSVTGSADRRHWKKENP